MKKIAVLNYKGGSGKTTTVANLAHGFSLKGYNVLMLDTDPQGSLGFYFNIEPKKTLYDLHIEKPKLYDCINNVRHKLDMICSNERVFPAEIKMAKMKERELLLKNKLKNLKGYDYVFIDCAPSMNLLNQNALLFADEIVVPVSMEYLSLIGVKQLLKNIKILNRIFKKTITIKKVIPTFFDSRHKKSKDITASLRRVFPDMISRPIRTSQFLSEAPGKRKTIFEYAPNSKVAEDYFEIVKELIND